MFTPTLRERIADVLAQAYGDQPDAAAVDPAHAAPHHRAANAVLTVLPQYGQDTDPQLRGAFARIEEAKHALASYEGDDVLGLMLHLVAILDGPPLPADTFETPRPLTTDRIRQRLVERLIACWPRMAYPDHAGDIAASLMDVIMPIVTQLQNQASGWHSQADRALTQRDRVRTTATTLEQIVAEATRLLLAGEPGPALTVLQSDGQPLGPCGSPAFIDDTPCARPAGHGGVHSDDPAYTDPPHQCPALPEKLFVVVAERGTAQAKYRQLDLNGAFSDVEGANARARDLVLELTPGDPTQMTDTADGSVTLASRPWGDFAGLIEVVALDLDPHIADAQADAERQAAGVDVDPDYGRDLDDEE